MSLLEEELSAVKEEKDHQLRQLRAKMEQNAQSLQHQYSIQEAKVGAYGLLAFHWIEGKGGDLWISHLWKQFPLKYLLW